MITALIFLNLSKNNLDKSKKLKENYQYGIGDATEAGSALAMGTFYMVLGFIMLALELIFMILNFAIVFKCTAPGAERIVNITLAIIIPIPYMFGNILFNDCAKNTLRSNKLF